MPIVPLREVMADAVAGGYGVPAINIVNDLTMEAVLAAAAREQSPIIVQTSMKTVRSIGADVIMGMWTAMASHLPVPAVLHLDHCPDRAVIAECLAKGWNSVLFDASALPVAENLRQTIEVVAAAREAGADVEGEIESITGVEDGVGTEEAVAIQPIDVAVDFIERTRIDVFAPAIGNAHGRYRATPRIDAERVSILRDRTGIPMALHGGSGLGEEVFRDLIARGCAKVNISTALKEVYLRASLEDLERARAADRWDPPSHFSAVREAVIDLTVEHIRMFGSAHRA